MSLAIPSGPAPTAARRQRPGVLPGFGISMGYAVLYQHQHQQAEVQHGVS